MAPSPAQLFDAYTTATTTTRARVLAFVRASWGGLDAWHASDIDTFVRRVVPVVNGGQVRAASLTDAYLAAIASLVLGVPNRPVGIPHRLVNDQTMRGVPAADVYRRTGPTVWTALSNGRTLDDAVSEGLTRALVAAATDLQLAKTHATRYALERNDGVVGYQRVPDDAACDLCLLASTQRYHSGDLMPIHDRCSCDVEPLFGDTDPGQIINADLLDRLDNVAAGTDVVVHEHGELGPVLTVAGQAFTGPDDI